MIKYNFLSRISSASFRTNRLNSLIFNVLMKQVGISNINHIQNECRRYKSSDMTGVAFSPLPDAELKIQLYYKAQEIKKRKEKLNEIAKSIWNHNPNVNYTRITLEECKKMYEEHTGRTASLWETNQIYITTLQQYAPWRHFQEEQQRQKHVSVIIDEIYEDLQKEVKQGSHLTLSKSEITVLLERKLGELPSSKDIEDVWMNRSRLPLVKWIE